jgi:hypothetical protein
MPWYTSLISPHVETFIRIAMVKQSSAIDELWNILNDAGITDQIGTPSKKEI